LKTTVKLENSNKAGEQQESWRRVEKLENNSKAVKQK
jgi:hypothetical protein